MTLASWSAPRGLDPTPDEARKWLSDELNGSEYHDQWLDSAIRWILDQINKLLEGANSLTHGALSTAITVAVALAVIAILVWVVPRVRREPVAAASDGAVLEDLRITPRTYRDRAAQAFEEGRLDDAVLDGFRAIARDMSDRSLLNDAPGRTAHEVSLALALPFPGHADRLVEAANSFDAIRYGHRHATAGQAEQVLQLDAELVRTAPMLATTPLQDLSL
jgi:hypothetical protein